MSVVSLLAVNIMGEDRNHVLISLGVKVMNLVAFVDYVCHHFWRRRVDDGRGDHVGHISMVPVFRDTEFLVAVKLSNGCKVDITSKNRHAD